MKKATDDVASTGGAVTPKKGPPLHRQEAALRRLGHVLGDAFRILFGPPGQRGSFCSVGRIWRASLGRSFLSCDAGGVIALRQVAD